MIAVVQPAQRTQRTQRTQKGISRPRILDTRRDNDDQDLEGECLTLITNSVICWNTVYTQAALTHLEHTTALPIDGDLIARVSPTGHKHVNFLRPLRVLEARRPTRRHAQTATPLKPPPI